ncbi:MAG: hypothetical protein AB1792_06520 [Candidatus Zixiibacteriota bacterium]
MRGQRCGVFTVVLCGVVLTLAVAGCSGDKGNGPSGNMTKGEQYEEMGPFMEELVVSTVDEFGTEFWDGVDEGDVSQSVPIRIPGSGKRVAAHSDSLSIIYYPLRGWWIITAQLDVDSENVSGSVQLRDSVRFETVAGVPQAQPDATTYRFRHGGWLTMTLEGSEDGTEVTFGMTAGRAADVVGLNGDVATVNGSSAGSFDLHGSDDEGSADLTFEFETSVSQVDIPVTPGNYCPTDGSMHANIQIDFDIRSDSAHAQAKGAWDADVDFTGNGGYDITVSSGDFSAEKTGTLECAQPY